MGGQNQGMPSQWGDLSQNNGWGAFNTGPSNPNSNPYPSLDSGPNPLQMLGAAFGGVPSGNMGPNPGNNGTNLGNKGNTGGLNNPQNQY